MQSAFRFGDAATHEVRIDPGDPLVLAAARYCLRSGLATPNEQALPAHGAGS
jgi:hypothetical protein